MVMLGFGSGGVLTGKITDRYGIVAAIGLGIGMLGLGYLGAGIFVVDLAVHPAAFCHRARRLGDLRPADGGSLALVRAATAALRSRIAASGNYIGGTIWPSLINLGHAVGRLAPHPYRGRRLHRGGHLGAGAGVVAPADGGGGARAAMSTRGAAALDLQTVDQCADRDPVAGRHRLLRGDVDAAGSHRRLLRRSRLWRGARRRNAVADARLRHHQPDRFGLPRRPHRRHPHAVDRLDRARRRAACSICSSTASPRSI